MERELLLLGLLRQQEQHGYRLMEFIETNLATCTDLKKSTAYFLLDKMAQRGWVTASQVQAGKRPRRQVYSITPAGEQVFAQMLQENLQDFVLTTFPGDIGLIFLSALPQPEALALLETRLQNLRLYLEQLAAAPQHSGSAQLLIEHQLLHLHSEEVWLTSLIDRLHGPSL